MDSRSNRLKRKASTQLPAALTWKPRQGTEFRFDTMDDDLFSDESDESDIGSDREQGVLEPAEGEEEDLVKRRAAIWSALGHDGDMLGFMALPGQDRRRILRNHLVGRGWVQSLTPSRMDDYPTSKCKATQLITPEAEDLFVKGLHTNDVRRAKAKELVEEAREVYFGENAFKVEADCLLDFLKQPGARAGLRMIWVRVILGKSYEETEAVEDCKDLSTCAGLDWVAIDLEPIGLGLRENELETAWEGTRRMITHHMLGRCRFGLMIREGVETDYLNRTTKYARKFVTGSGGELTRMLRIRTGIDYDLRDIAVSLRT